MKPKLLFFARDYQTEFFLSLQSEKYESLLVTLTTNEKRRIEKRGLTVTACFEEEFDRLPVADFPNDYLKTSFSSDRYLRYVSIFKRRRNLGKEISFWSRIMDEHTPALVINETIAIEISEVLYIEAEKRDIKYLSWMNLSIKNHFYWQSTPIHNSLDPSIFNSAPDPVSNEKADEYMAKVQNGSGRPFYVNSLRGRYSLYSLCKNIYWTMRCLLREHRYRDDAKNKAIFGDNVSFYTDRINAFINSFFFGYDDLDKFQDFEVIFYPLHYEPEAALFYMAEFFDNQAASIENYAKCLRHNQVLVLKEHPQQPGVLLQRKFRMLKKRISNIVFLPGEYSTYHLLKRSKLVVTLGSTAGIEALILGIPVVIMGKVFYDQYENVNPIEDYNELREFIKDERKWKYADPVSLRKFLAQIIYYSKPGNPFPHQDLYTGDNIRNIVSAIETELERKLTNVVI